jgi:hypothetical protein
MTDFATFWIAQQENCRLMEAFALGRDPDVLAEDIVLCDQGQERSFYGRVAVIAFLDAIFRQGFVQTEVK